MREAVQTAHVHHVDRQCERLIGATTMRGILQKFVIAATTVLGIAAFFGPAKAEVVVTSLL